MPESAARADAQDSLFFERELEHVKAKVWEVDRPPFSAFDLFPLSTEVDEGAEVIVWRELDKVGVAKVIASYATDLPRVDAFAQENISPVRTIGVAYGYSTQDIRAARLAGRPLDSTKAMAARQANDQRVNEVAWRGDRKHGLKGIFQTAGANIVAPVAAVAAPNGTEWNSTSGKTADEILTDLHNLVQAPRTATNDVERPDTLVLPTDEYAYINSTPRSATSDTTILDFFRRTHPEIRSILTAVELNDVPVAYRPSGTGSAAVNIGMAFNRSPDKITHEIPMMFRQHAPQLRNLEQVVPCESRTGGVIVYRPLAIAFMEAI